MVKNLVVTIFSIILLSFGLSCSSSDSESISNLIVKREDSNSNSGKDKLDVAQFEKNRDLWKSQNIKNYKITLEANGFLTNFPRPVEFEIKNLIVRSSKSLQAGNNYVVGYKDFNTIEKIFSFIEEEHKRNPDKLNVQFDEKLGYPIQIELDEKKDWADDELTLKVKSLEITK